MLRRAFLSKGTTFASAEAVISRISCASECFCSAFRILIICYFLVEASDLFDLKADLVVQIVKRIVLYAVSVAVAVAV